MSKEYVKIALNELKMLLESEIMLNNFNKNNLRDWKNYNELYFKTKALLSEDIRKDMENRIDKLGLQLTVRLGGMLIVAVGALTAILIFMH